MKTNTIKNLKVRLGNIVRGILGKDMINLSEQNPETLEQLKAEKYISNDTYNNAINSSNQLTGFYDNYKIR